jgi:hypothetical protein
MQLLLHARCLDLSINKQKVDRKLVKQIIQILYIGKNEHFKKGVPLDIMITKQRLEAC